MARKTDQRATQNETLWPLEAEQIELEDYMNRLLAARESADPPAELDWLRDALEESWPRVFAEVDAAVC